MHKMFGPSIKNFYVSSATITHRIIIVSDIHTYAEMYFTYILSAKNRAQ